MARYVFFSFHYQRDIFRVNQIRKHSLTKGSLEEAGYIDHSLWEKSKQRGDAALQQLIEDGLRGTSVTAVLIGYETAHRKWVDYEIRRSYELGKGIIGVYISQMKDISGKADPRGVNPLSYWHYTDGNGQKVYFSQVYPTYDWVDDDGYANFGSWVEKAAKMAGK